MQLYKSPRDSEIEMALLMQPEHANFGGNIHGGYLLSLMDQAAYACASKHSRQYCVTASVNTVNFRTPIHVGDLITIKARINYTGATSMVVGMRVEAENLIEGSIRHSNSSYFTMVAKNPDGKPSKIAGLILESSDDFRRFIRAHERRDNQLKRLKRYHDEHFVLDKDCLAFCAKQNATFDPNILSKLTVKE